MTIGELKECLKEFPDELEIELELVDDEGFFTSHGLVSVYPCDEGRPLFLVLSNDTPIVFRP